jgi:hypothetical protein
VVNVPLDADQVISNSYTFAYYEQPHGVSQQELIPVWAYRADFLKGGSLIAGNVLVYVPASPDYDPPVVTIDGPANGSSFAEGRRLRLNADVSQDSGFGPFTYTWTSTQPGTLGTTATISPTLSATGHEGSSGPTRQTFSVKVTNKNGQSRTVTVSYDVVAPMELPMIWR